MQRRVTAYRILVDALLEGCDARQRATVLGVPAGSTSLCGRLDAELRAGLVQARITPGTEAGVTLYPLLHVLLRHAERPLDALPAVAAALPLDAGEPGLALLSHLLHRPPDPRLEGRWREAVTALCDELSFPALMSLEWELARRARIAAAVTWGPDPQRWPREAYARLHEIETALY